MLTFTTTGSLGPPNSANVDEYGTIIMDELHEESVQGNTFIFIKKDSF